MPEFFRTGEPGFKDRLDTFLHWEETRSAVLQTQVADILADVKTRGDAAIIDYSNRWDKTDYKSAEDFILTPAHTREIVQKCPAEVAKALEHAATRIRNYHLRQLPVDMLYQDKGGTTLGWKWTPITRAGLYVPGGSAAYPSSVLMNAIPALTAGVKELAMVVPAPGGALNPAIVTAAQIAGVKEIYVIGGAQAVGALTYGTASIRKVDKIVGPGNAFVAEAKRQVFGRVGIDMIAGPSEILVIADAAANPRWIAADLLSQAEHDPDARAMLVTDSEPLAKAVIAQVEAILPTLLRREIATASWQKNGVIVLTKDLQEAAEVNNFVAPEHTELMVADPDALLPLITATGAIFMGAYTPEAIGDYIAGPSHVLPTSGSAKFSSGLSVYDFLKRSSIMNCSRESFATLNVSASRLAQEEGLTAHQLSVDIRSE